MTKLAERQRQEFNLAFEDFLDVAQIAEIRLVSSVLKSTPPAVRTPDTTFKFSHGCEVASTYYDEESKCLLGYVDAYAVCRIGRKQVARLTARYVAIYRVEGRPDEQVAAKFLRVVGTVAVYPYFRAHFAEISAQAGFRFPPLPIMRTPRRAIAAWAKDPKPNAKSRG